MIEIHNITKTFKLEAKTIVAVDDLSLRIQDGEIFGVIGESGAGKSTLVRCINLLERPSQGSILHQGVDLMTLSSQEVLKVRRKIGMIFQQFNLFTSRTVFENIAYPLKGLPKEEIKRKVNGLLALVGIEDKVNAYPSQLSGGQKQRVAIARALANDPDVLLCDEATSALDPQTTQQILNLLRDLNRKLGITIVLITHEMSVIKSICQRVAVMNNGRLVEIGPVAEIFFAPKHAVTQAFVNSTHQAQRFIDMLKNPQGTFDIKPDNDILRIDFIGSETTDPLISRISRNFEVDTNIVYANIDIIQDIPLGTLVVILSGTHDGRKSAIEALRQHVRVEVISHG
jgi:D-methionine transport system ATP-binding protein